MHPLGHRREGHLPESLTLMLALTLVGGCRSSEAPAPSPQTGVTAVTPTMKLITGTVTYRERIALPPGATVVVVLEDVSRMDVSAHRIVQTTFPAEGGPPYRFRLAYDPGKISDRMRYSLRARIEVGERLMFTSTEQIAPFDRAPGEPIDILVTRAGGNR